MHLPIIPAMTIGKYKIDLLGVATIGVFALYLLTPLLA